MNKRYNEQDPAPQYDPETARIRRALRAQKARRRKKMRSRRLFLLGMALILLFVLVPNLWGRAERLLYPRKYEALVDQWAETYGLDPLLVDAFIRTESGFDPQATSSVDARGLMQMTEETFIWLRSKIAPDEGLTFDELYDPDVSIRFGCYYIHLCMERYGGDVAVGAMTVITSVSQLCTMPIQGICQGGQPVMSFNFGAGKKPRVKEAFRFQLTLCFGYTTLFWLLMMLAPGAVAGIFTSDTALIDYTTWSMRIYMAGILAMGVQIACQQSFMALGQAKVSLLLACLRKIILLIPLIFILPHLLPNPVFGVFLAEPVSDILAATITTITFFSRFNGILERGAAKV